ncbi:MAG TPA: ABC transporter ATP-binding protein, partial [Actinopolymorphaceae bacterium]|nr:ABC transporter ATP-binding protein [Actinopolymorphaceae bacterium]
MNTLRKALASMWLVLSMSVRVSPRETAVAFLETLSNALQVLHPLFLTWFVTGAATHDVDKMIVATLAFGGVSSLSVMMMLAGNTARINQRERVGFAFDCEIARMTSAIPTLDHLESARYLDELQVLRDQQGALGNALNSVLNTVRGLVFAGGTIVLASTADWRLLLLAVAGLPNLLTTTWSIRWQAAAEKVSAEPGRLTTHLVDLGTTSAGAAETRVFDLSEPIHRRLRTAVDAWRAPMTRLGRQNAGAQAVNTVIFYAAVTGVLGWMLHDVASGRVGADAMILAVMLVGRLQSLGEYLQWSVRMISYTVRTTNRFIWLRDYFDRVASEHHGAEPAPARLVSGIRTENLTYNYPETATPALDGVTLELPAGAVVALVGENGAGKSTLVKLLTGMYRPTAGRILVDGADLATLDLTEWRERTTGAFQDYARFELSALETIGVGDLSHVRDNDRVLHALRSGASEDLLNALPDGLATQLGTTWPDGVELSGGQWQRLAIARGMMRQHPLLLVLDEPTAALDAATEHALFERYAEAA